MVGWEALSSWFHNLQDLHALNIVFDESHKGKAKARWEAQPLRAKDDPKYAELRAALEQRGGILKENEDGEEVMLLPLDNIASCASRLAQRAKRRLATTATPLPDRVRDLWGQLDLIEPFQWGRHRDFVLRYCDAVPSLYGGLDDRGTSNLPELAERLTWVVHRVAGKVARASLPPKRREPWYIPESEQSKPTGGWKNAAKAAAKLGHAAMLELRLFAAASAKRGPVMRRASEHFESKHKVVIFTGRKLDCEDLSKAAHALKGPGKPAAIWVGHGGHSQQERRKMLREYMEHPGPCLLIGTGEAWGTAIDGLQCTDAAIFALLPPTPGALDQWEGRFTRLGQDRPVIIYYPIATGTADEHLATILLDKLPAVEFLAPTDSLDGAAEALSGHEADPHEFARAVLDALSRADADDDDW